MLIHIVTQYALSTKWKLSDFGIQQSTVSQFSLWKLSRWNMQIDLNIKVELAQILRLRAAFHTSPLF